MLHADLSTVYDGLNALGRVPWKINDRILKVAQQCWSTNVAVGDIPSRLDYALPVEPIAPERPSVKLEKGSSEYKEYLEATRRYREETRRYNRIRQKNMVSTLDDHAERCFVRF